MGHDCVPRHILPQQAELYMLHLSREFKSIIKKAQRDTMDELQNTRMSSIKRTFGSLRNFLLAARKSKKKFRCQPLVVDVEVDAYLMGLIDVLKPPVLISFKRIDISKYKLSHHDIVTLVCDGEKCKKDIYKFENGFQGSYTVKITEYTI
tara:strand:+ start:12099 stop:12548 length:450 start_codon:yes stop_codon:yes gene_type:complete